MMEIRKQWLCIAVAPVVILMATSLVEGRGLYDKSPELAQLIEELLQSNEELQSMDEERAALEAEISVAGALDDPRLGVGVSNLPTDTFSFNQEPMTQKQLFIAQKLPWFGKLDLRTQKAAIIVERQKALIEAKRLELIKSLSTTFYDLGFVVESLQVNAELTQMVSRMLQVAEAGYASGKSLQQDVFQAQVELGKLIDERVSLEKRKRTMAARINELLNRPEFLEVDVPVDPGSLEIQLDPEITKQLALTHNPMLRVRQADIDRASINIDLAARTIIRTWISGWGMDSGTKIMTGRNCRILCLPSWWSMCPSGRNRSRTSSCLRNKIASNRRPGHMRTCNTLCRIRSMPCLTRFLPSRKITGCSAWA